MRTYADLCAAVKSCGIPYARVSWNKDDPESIPGAPNVLLVPEDTLDIMADATNYQKATMYRVELYEHGSSLALEEKFEQALTDAGFEYTRHFVQLEDGICELAYYLTVLGR